MERYQLSQDFADKQLQLLQRKYGGAKAAGKAALTIQRAYRRYSMAKKFADLTAQVKTEKRISRRLDYNASTAATVSHQNSSEEQQHTPQQQPSPRELHHQGSLHKNHSQLGFLGSGGSGDSGGTGDPNSNSCPDIQSFPLDETSIYTFHHSSSGTTVVTPSAATSSSSRPLRSSSSRSTEAAISTVDGSPRNRRPSSKGPSLPRRTISQLSSSQLQSTPPSSSSSSSQIRRQHSLNSTASAPVVSYSMNEVIRKRHYRTGLNIFNKKPEKGIAYLIRRGFLENNPQAVARFLITRKGLSKQMIGEYLGNLLYQFNMAVLNYFASEMDFSGMQLDTALRKFQTYFRMPGEAQKIERLVEVFSSRYCQCNVDAAAKLHSTDTIFILAFAIILLNTDLHTPTLKPDKRMKLEDFIRNLRSIDDGHDVDPEMLRGIYERIRSQEFRPGNDHVTQVIKVQQTIVQKCPNLAVPHRRLVCYCRLYEVQDIYKKERPGIHQREVFLFNDILVITKIHSRKKNTVTYAFRQSHLLAGMSIHLFETQFYPFGIQVVQKWDRKVVLMLNARNEHDRSKFVEDLRESIAEMDEMETLRLEAELEKQRLSLIDNNNTLSQQQQQQHQHSSLRAPSQTQGASSSSSSSQQHTVVNADGVVLRRSAINNSLLDLSEASAEKMTRRGSVGSLDSGMSVSFQSTSVGSFCVANGNGHHHHPHHHHHHHHHSHHSSAPRGHRVGQQDTRRHHSQKQ